MAVEPQLTELIGEYRTNIDAKGRVGLGSFRQHFEDTVIAVKMDGYLVVMSPAQFRVVSEGIRQRTAIDRPEHVGRLFDVEVQRFKRHEIIVAVSVAEVCSSFHGQRLQDVI